MNTLLCIVGPTAAGKTRMGVDVALALAALGHRPEIVSCDSMAVYRGLDIVAAKPSAPERAEIPHHLLDVVSASDEFTAVTYRALARSTIDSIAAGGGVPILVGGSGLYFRAVVDELAFAPTDESLRRRLNAEDTADLFARLRDVDPASAERLDPRNKRRVVRALEIHELTGRPATELRTQWDERAGPYDTAVVGITWDRPELLARVEQRIQRQLHHGMIEEVKRLLPGGLSRTARQALGVKEIIPFVEGSVTLEEATVDLLRNSKNFVRRQLSWFGADPRVEWVNASELGWDGARERILAGFVSALS